MRLALFDLDHTLIPFDSGLAFTRFLVASGRAPAAAQDRHLAACQAYVAGGIDIQALHRASVAVLVGLAPAQRQAWLLAFEAAMAARLPDAMRALVRRHRAQGDRCAIVTATTRCLAEPFARLFEGIELVATDAEIAADGTLTGAIAGLPCRGEHKPLRVAQWLAQPGPPAAPRTLDGHAASTFYSDAIGDLPLLRAVSHPVAVRPDAALRAHAGAAGWPVLDVGAS